MPVSGDVANTARSYPNCVFVRSCSPQLYLRRRLPRGITAGFLFTLRSSSLQLLGGDITTWLTPPSPRVSLRPLAGPWPCPSRPRDCRKGPAAVRVPAMETPSSTLVAGWRRSRLLRPLAFAFVYLPPLLPKVAAACLLTANHYPLTHGRRQLPIFYGRLAMDRRRLICHRKVIFFRLSLFLWIWVMLEA